MYPMATHYDIRRTVTGLLKYCVGGTKWCHGVFRVGDVSGMFSPNVKLVWDLFRPFFLLNQLLRYAENGERRTAPYQKNVSLHRNPFFVITEIVDDHAGSSSG